MNNKEILEKLEYDPDRGELRWKERPESDFSRKSTWKRWNTLFAGQIAGGEHNGCLQLRFDGKSYQAGRLAYEIATGEPLSDHHLVGYVDGNPFNLRPGNLYIVSRSNFSRQLVSKYAHPVAHAKWRREHEQTDSAEGNCDSVG